MMETKAFRHNEETGPGAIFFRTWALIVFFGIIQTIVAAWPLLRDGWFVTYDAFLHIQRVEAVAYAVRHGDLYPRWITAAAAGKGSEFLNFYPPAFYLAAGYLHALGVPLLPAVKTVCMLGLFLGWLGMFFWARRHFDIFGAMIASTIFLFVPYHFDNLYIRGALPELTAINLLPWLFLGIDTIYSQNHYLRGLALTASATAAITLTHNLVGFMVAPFAAIYILWRTFTSGDRLRMFLKAAAGPAAGIGLSAFYWLPVLAEAGYLYDFRGVLLSRDRYYEHFASPIEWLARYKPGYVLQYGSVWARQNFQIGYVLLGFAALSLMVIIGAKGKRGFGITALVLGLLGLFMTITPSTVIYKNIELMQFVLFPFSYLGTATLFLAALTGYSTSFKPVTRMPAGPALLLLIAFALCVFASGNQRAVSSRRAIKEDIPTLMGISVIDEFRPRWETMPVTPKIYHLLYADPGIQAEQLQTGGSGIRLQTKAVKPGNMTITQFYFPGWKLSIDGRDSPIYTTPEGFIKFRVPAGLHSIKLWFGTTWPRVTGWAVSVLAAITILFFLIRGAIKKDPRPSHLSGVRQA
ncbi:MAG: 6-pyruvoyl-tetrahydropterin synthase-related protein [Nitrospiraceae bacterium]|nr:6-pyruvoyl-tetrahydropterin synthase-related protein [Nitrospiraceae bacterium]